MTSPDYRKTYPGRKPQGGVHALVKGRGRAWIESINSLKGTAIVRFDPSESAGMRSRAHKVPLASIDFERGWKFA